MDTREHFAGKRITVMGLGLLGRGVGDAKFLAEQGATLTITDLKTAEQLADSLAELSAYSGIEYVLGEHRLEDFQNRDYVLKAAGVPADSPYIAEAKRNGIPVKMSASWFLELANIPAIGVTGTRGKSTVTHMLHAILKEAAWPTILGGNVRGVSTLAQLPIATEEHIALMELDSWQLQGFGESKLSPDIAVFTTLMADHMNYYKDDMDAYLADKANIFLYQEPDDTLVVGNQVSELIEEKYSDRIRSHMVVVGAHDFRADWELKIPGEHNRYNAALAMEAARALDIDDETIERSLAGFEGVPGRIELVAMHDGIAFYNDTTATTPDATIAALRALDPEGKKNIVLIMGGADKGLSMDELFTTLPETVKHVSLLAGTGSDRIQERVPGINTFTDLKSAFADALGHAEEGDIVLLSPAFASFGMFKNEYDRGDQFIALVNAHA